MTEVTPEARAAARAQLEAEGWSKNPAERGAFAPAGPGPFAQFMTWLAGLGATETKRGFIARYRAGMILVLGLVLGGYFAPAAFGIGKAVNEVIHWGIQLIGFALVGIFILWMLMISFRTILDPYTVREEIVAILEKLLPSDAVSADGLYLIAGAILAGLTFIGACMVISTCLLIPFLVAEPSLS